MTDIQRIMGNLDLEGLCKYCKYSSECSGGVRGGPDDPIYPPCADGLDEDDFDLESYLEDAEDEDET